jgi:hypothetical protein
MRVEIFVKVPLEVRFASAVVSIGAVVGCIFAVLNGGKLHDFIIWTFVGSSIGAMIGFRIGEKQRDSEDKKPTDYFVLTSERLNIIIGFAFTVSGVFLLLTVGWDFRIFLATLFFGIGTVYLSYFH